MRPTQLTIAFLAFLSHTLNAKEPTEQSKLERELQAYVMIVNAGSGDVAEKYMVSEMTAIGGGLAKDLKNGKLREYLLGSGNGRMVSAESIDDFLTKNKASEKISGSFPPEFKHQLVSDVDLAAIYQKGYSPAVYRVSAIGFNKAKTEALVCYSSSGTGGFVALHKVGSLWTSQILIAPSWMAKN